MIESADVILWGTRIGCVVRRDGVPYAEFEYAPDLIGCGIEPSSIEMPVASRVYKFPSLPYASFHGLPGLLSDSVPDKFGNAVIDIWLKTQGRAPVRGQGFTGPAWRSGERACRRTEGSSAGRPSPCRRHSAERPARPPP